MKQKTDLASKLGQLPEGVTTFPVGDNVGEARLPCPNCGGSIGLRLVALLAGQPTWCSGCGAKLDFNPVQNRGALAAWQSFSNKVEEIQRAASGSSRQPKRRRRIR